MSEEFYPVDNRPPTPVGEYRDPVFEHKGKWYWWDETGADYHGPFDTPLEARQRLDAYCKWLENRDPLCWDN